MATGSVIDLIAVLAPQWSSDPRINDFITIATMRTSDCFGEKKNLAIALRVCHMLALEALNGGNPGDGTDSGGGSVTGPVTQEKEDALWRSFGSGGSGSNTEKAGELGMTTFGMQLWQLAKECLILARTSYITGCN